jgi:hypothetical protein
LQIIRLWHTWQMKYCVALYSLADYPSFLSTENLTDRFTHAWR